MIRATAVLVAALAGLAASPQPSAQAKRPTAACPPSGAKVVTRTARVVVYQRADRTTVACSRVSGRRRHLRDTAPEDGVRELTARHHRIAGTCWRSS